MTAITDPPELDQANVPGGLEVQLRREVPGGIIEFESAPAGYLTADGERRRRDHRAYYWTASDDCAACCGTGRQPSEKRPAPATVKCKACNGVGTPKRTRKVSVTTLLDAILPKPGLPPWSEARGIEGVIHAMRGGLIDASTDPADAVKIVREAKLGADREKKLAADRGLNVHALLEHYMLTGNAPDLCEHPVEHHGYVQGLCRWLLKNDPEPECVEQLVCDPVAGYAGRRDLVARIDGRRIGWDAKTQENAGIYTGAHVQLQMYERGAIACGDEPCDELRVVVFAADGGFREMLCEAMPRTVEVALEWYREVSPIDSLCEGHNRFEKEARKAAA